MAYTTINKPSNHFDTLLWTGDNSSTRNISGLNFQPDLSFKKERNGSFSIGNMWYDSVRGLGVDKHLNSTSDAIEGSGNDDLYGYYTGFISDGFSVTAGSSSSDYVNSSSYNYVAWNWKANGAGVANTAGTISSTVSANTTSGFSIVSYAGAQGSNFTIGHGLSVTPNIVFAKSRNTVTDWGVYYRNNGVNTNYMSLNNTSVQGTNNGSLAGGAYMVMNSTTLQIDSGAFANAGSSMIAYCFAEVKGYSKFGSYTGNGSTDGTFVYTGFKPAFVIIKCSNNTFNWIAEDNKRNNFNVVNKYLLPNTSATEGTLDLVDFLSNGIKIRTTDNSHNGSSNTYIYMAFAEQPLVGTNNVAATAR